jgi:hypothetical protein
VGRRGSPKELLSAPDLLCIELAKLSYARTGLGSRSGLDTRQITDAGQNSSASPIVIRDREYYSLDAQTGKSTWPSLPEPDPPFAGKGHVETDH